MSARQGKDSAVKPAITPWLIERASEGPIRMRQCTIKLRDAEGQRGNFFAYGAFERIIQRGWMLKHRIDFQSDGEILVFEHEDMFTPPPNAGWPYDVPDIKYHQDYWKGVEHVQKGLDTTWIPSPKWEGYSTWMRGYRDELAHRGEKEPEPEVAA